MGGRHGEGGESAQAKVREKYRQLKKALQAEFKALCAAARDGRPPRPEQVESFLALAEMAAADESSVSGAGLETYRVANREFLEDCRAVRAARRDPGALAAVLERLERRKAECHATFK